jgi:aminoglycoside 6'-N-acetyltransferase
VELVPFEEQRDAGLLRRWLHAPHVSRWWGDPQRELAAVLEPPTGGAHALILADGLPVGYLRWQPAPRTELEEAGLSDIPEGAIDIDLLIGEPERIGRGVGSAALRLALAHIRDQRGAPLVMICASVENAPALCACEKAGFRRVRTFDDGEYGQMWLLTAHARGAAPDGR